MIDINKHNAHLLRSFVICVITFTSLVMIASPCSAYYKEGQINASYDCVLCDPSFDGFEMNVSFSIDLDDYDVNITSGVVLPSELEAFIVLNSVVNTVSMQGMSPYYQGTRHSSWMTDRAVYNETGGILRVYSIETSIIYFMEGNLTINGSSSFFSMLMTRKSGVFDVIMSTTWLMTLLIVMACAVFFIFIFYVLFIKRRRDYHREMKKIEKSGNKLRSHNQKKRDELTSKMSPKGKNTGKKANKTSKSETRYEKIK